MPNRPAPIEGCELEGLHVTCVVMYFFLINFGNTHPKVILKDESSWKGKENKSALAEQFTLY